MDPVWLGRIDLVWSTQNPDAGVASFPAGLVAGPVGCIKRQSGREKCPVGDCL